MVEADTASIFCFKALGALSRPRMSAHGGFIAARREVEDCLTSDFQVVFFQEGRKPSFIFEMSE